MADELRLGSLPEETVEGHLAGLLMDLEPSIPTMEAEQPTVPETEPQPGNLEPRHQPTVSVMTTPETKPPHTVAAMPGEPKHLLINRKLTPQTITPGKTLQRTTTGALLPTMLPRPVLTCLPLLLQP